MPSALTLPKRPVGGFSLKCSETLVCSDFLPCSEVGMAGKTPGSLTLTPKSTGSLALTPNP